METVNSKHANLMFFGDLVWADTELDILESFLKDITNFIEKTFKELSSTSTEDETLSDMLKKGDYEDSFGQILRDSFIISLVMILEKTLGNYCDEFQKYLEFKIKWKDFRGTLLDRFKLFTNAVPNFKAEISNNLWQDLQGVVSIRNCLIHSGGELKKFSDAPNVFAFFKKHKAGLNNNSIVVTSEICRESLKIVHDFVEEIHKCALKYFPGDYIPTSGKH